MGNYSGITELSFFSLTCPTLHLPSPCPPIPELPSLFLWVAVFLCLNPFPAFRPHLCESVHLSLPPPSPFFLGLSPTLRLRPFISRLSSPTPHPLFLWISALCLSDSGSLLPSLSPPPLRHPNPSFPARRSPEGKGAQGGPARSHNPWARPGDCGPGGCPGWGGGGRWVPAGAPGASFRPGSVGATAVGAHAAVRRCGVRGPGRLPAGARAPAQPAAPRWPIAGAVARADARTLPRAGLVRLRFPPLLSWARPRPGCPRGRQRPPRRCGEGGGSGPDGAGLGLRGRGCATLGAGTVGPGCGPEFCVQLSSGVVGGGQILCLLMGQELGLLAP